MGQFFYWLRLVKRFQVLCPVLMILPLIFLYLFTPVAQALDFPLVSIQQVRFWPHQSFAPGPNLTIMPITWNIIGLDSNDVNVGPNNFPVGVRVCNEGDAPATNVKAEFVWDSYDQYIGLRPGSPNTLSVDSLGAGECTDFYFEVSITRDSNAYDHTRRYHIQVTADGGISLSTPTPREIYVERLISQSRNAILDVQLDGVSIPPGGTMALVVGQTYTITLFAKTATNGYEQIETFINLPNTIFRINSVQASYSAYDTVSPDPLASTKLYADGCTWENDPNSPNYRSCLDTGKYGGNVVITYTVTIIGGGGTEETLHSLVYDFSGSSFHYNANYSANYRIAAIVDPTTLTIAKNFSPDPAYLGGVSRLTFTVSNPNPGAVSGVNFTDTLPSPLVIADPPNVGFSGCGSPTVTAVAGTDTITVTNITVGPNSSCVIGINVTASQTGTFTNTTGPLYVGAINTGNVATDTLTVNDEPPPPPPPTTCATPVTFATWEMPTSGQGSGGPPPPYTYKADDVEFAEALGALTSTPGATQTISTDGNPPNSWEINDAWPTGAPSGADNPPYFQFRLDTSNYGGIIIKFDTNLKPPGNWASDQNPFRVYASQDGSLFNEVGNFIASKGWQYNNIVTTTIAGGTTWFRLIAGGRRSGATTAIVGLDNIIFQGCERPKGLPTLTKAFLSNPVAVGGTSTLVFTLSHTNPVTLTGATFSDFLPEGLQVADPPNLANTCGGTVSGAVAGSTAITLTGGTIPPNGSCTISLNVKATTAGPHLNVTSFISTTETGLNDGPTGYGSDTLTALLPPEIEKNFVPNPIVSGTVSTLFFTIINPNVDNELTGVAFTDTFPSGIVVADPPNGSTSGCGSPTFNPTPGAGSISFSNGTIAPGGTCVVRVDVTATTTGTFTNTTGPVTADITGGTDTGSDTLIVYQPSPRIGVRKQVATSDSGPWRNFVAVEPGQNVYYRFVVENTGDITLTNVTVTDTVLGDLSACSWVNGNGIGLTMPFTLPVAGDDEGHIAYGVCGPVTAQTGIYTNTATADSDQTDPRSDDASYATIGLMLEKRAIGPWYNAGDVVTYTYVVTNTGYAPLQGPVTVTDTKTTVTCPPVTTVIPDGDNFLDPGEAITCTAYYTVTQEDVNTGAITNTARAAVEGFYSNFATVVIRQSRPTAVEVVDFRAGGAPVTALWIGVIGVVFLGWILIGARRLRMRQMR